MKNCEGSGRNGDHDTVKDDEFGFVTHDLVAPATRHLWNTVDASSKDSYICDKDTGEEESEFQVVTESRGGLREPATAKVDPDKVFDKEASEDCEDNYLEDDTRKHQVASNIDGVRTVGSAGSSASTSALEDERKQVAADEDPSVPVWWYAREFLAEGVDEMFQREVNPGGNEGWRNNQAADLHIKPGGAEWISVH